MTGQDHKYLMARLVVESLDAVAASLAGVTEPGRSGGGGGPPRCRTGPPWWRRRSPAQDRADPVAAAVALDGGGRGVDGDRGGGVCDNVRCSARRIPSYSIVGPD